MGPAVHHGRRARQRGIALLLVLWIFMLLGVLALDFARYMRDDAMAAVNLADETRGYYLALAGMHRALFDAKRAAENDPSLDPTQTPNQPGGPNTLNTEEEVRVPPDGEWHEETFAGGRYAVRMTDLGSRISLNRVNESLLTRVVTHLIRGGNTTTGVDRRTEADVSTVVDAILDWRDTDDLARVNGAESEYYLGLRTPYQAKNGWFSSEDELRLVKGVTTELFYGHDGLPGLREVVSAFNPSQAINIRYAPAAVLEVLLDVLPDEAAELATQRDSDPEGILETVLRARMAAIDPGNVDLLVNREPRIVLIEARADTSVERNQSRIAAVADVSAEASEGAKIIRWLDRAPWEGGLPAGESDREGRS